MAIQKPPLITDNLKTISASPKDSWLTWLIADNVNTFNALTSIQKRSKRQCREAVSSHKENSLQHLRRSPCPGLGTMSSLASGNSSKAGLPQSFEEINEIIKEASKESKFTAAQEKKSAQLRNRIETLKSELQAALKQAKLVSRARRQVDDLIASFEAQQALQFALHETECAVCVDMDAFFAAVECLDAPELKDVPMAVGSSAMLSTANYEARKFGVSAAMPGYIAMKLCPQLRIVPLNYEKYQKYSAQVAAILTEYDPSLTMFSLDEAFLHLKRGKDDPSFAEIVDEMRARVKKETGLTCSAGIASNILLAKMASNIKKPDGQFEIPRQDPSAMKKFLHAQPVKKISGVGKVMAALLEGVLSISTIGDLVKTGMILISFLFFLVSKSAFITANFQGKNRSIPGGLLDWPSKLCLLSRRRRHVCS